MIDENYASTGTGRKYKGYVIDLMDEMARNLNFSYKVRVVADGQYGAQYRNSDGAIKWTGVVGEIVDGVSVF